MAPFSPSTQPGAARNVCSASCVEKNRTRDLPSRPSMARRTGDNVVIGAFAARLDQHAAPIGHSQDAAIRPQAGHDQRAEGAGQHGARPGDSRYRRNSTASDS